MTTRRRSFRPPTLLPPEDPSEWVAWVGGDRRRAELVLKVMERSGTWDPNDWVVLMNLKEGRV